MDLILSDIQQFPALEKEVMAEGMLLTLGSSSAIFASNLSAIGNNVAFIGMVGKDSFGEKVISSLDAKNVNTTSIVVSNEHKTGITVAMVYQKERAMVTFAGAMNHFGNEQISDDLLKSAKHLHISSIFLQPQLKQDLYKLLNRAKDFGLTISLDPQWDPNEKWDLDLEAIFDLVDVFLPNSAEWKCLCGNADLKNSMLKFKNRKAILVVKDGINGAYCWHQENLIFQQAFICLPYADAIGAGDSFDAGFIHAFIQHEEVSECLLNGCLMGALNTTCAGGTAAFSSEKDIAKFIENTLNTN